MAVKINLKIITKNHAADQEIGFLTKSISNLKGCATAMPTGWELNNYRILKNCNDCDLVVNFQFFPTGQAYVETIYFPDRCATKFLANFSPQTNAS